MEILFLVVIAILIACFIFVILQLNNEPNKLEYKATIKPQSVETKQIASSCPTPQRKKQSTIVAETVLQKQDEELVYNLNTDKIKYYLYNAKEELDFKSYQLYKKIIYENLWISEPFYTKFYDFLLTLEKNNFMIIDPNTNVITMNMRDENNKMHVSKSYQVFSVQDIAIATIKCALDNISQFQTSDAQNIIIAIFVIVLKQSVHYLSHDAQLATIDNLLDNYEYKKNVEHIVSLVEQKDNQLTFVHKALAQAFNICNTFPFNDSELPEPLQIPLYWPIKFLQPI